MHIVKVFAKVAMQDIIIFYVFTALGCAISAAGVSAGTNVAYVMFMLTWPMLLLLFFFSNAELFKWVKNEYVWSLSTGITSIFMVTYAVMYVTHNTCKVPLL